MSEYDPWNGLSAGGTDSRRVDAKGQFDWFWTLLPPTQRGLVLRLPELPAETSELPSLKSVSVQLTPMGSGGILLFKLLDPAHSAVFEIFCRDLVATSGSATDPANAVAKALLRAHRWHLLLRKGNSDLLSEEEQKGLMGELDILEHLAAAIGPIAAIQSWKGPYGAPKDFEAGKTLIEVKTRRAAARPYVRISSEFQLADVAGCRLYLAVSALTRATGGEGHTLTERVHAITSRLSAVHAQAVPLLEQALAEAGFDPEDDYSHYRWETTEADYFEVDGDFPRILPPTVSGVSDVSYVISLAECEPFRTTWGHIWKGIRT